MNSSWNRYCELIGYTNTVGPIEPEILGQTCSMVSSTFPDIWTGRTSAWVGLELSITREDRQVRNLWVN